MTGLNEDINFTWKHLLAIVSIIGFVATMLVCGFGLLGAKADQQTVVKLAADMACKADKSEVVRVETQVRYQIQEVKKDLQKDIGEVKETLDKIYVYILKDAK